MQWHVGLALEELAPQKEKLSASAWLLLRRAPLEAAFLLTPSHWGDGTQLLPKRVGPNFLLFKDSCAIISFLVF